MLKEFHIDVWTVWGLAAQGLYFARFVLQWVQSEKEGKIVVPHVFWILSLIGASMIIVYAVARKDIVFLIAGTLQLIIFSRSLAISRRSNHE